MIREIRIGAKRGEPVHHENITVDDGDDDGGFSFEIRKVDVNPVGEDDGVNDRITPPLGGVVDGAPSESIGIMGIPSEFNDRLQKTAVSVSCSENVGRSAEKILCVRIGTLFQKGAGAMEVAVFTCIKQGLIEPTIINLDGRTRECAHRRIDGEGLKALGSMPWDRAISHAFQP